ncbi:B3 domain-containing protein Os01g0723500 isoform X2 [Ziziphus jujuba]|nr:B3 domain-containing protein Os01g0723500 isoform X2 [Ziziphus jujuba]XP_024930729.3 B3 domain-containing protein Os01g0723500 isoform X2 [Ziziphus jujuba]
MQHLEGRTYGSVSLVGPSGNTWQVNLVQQNDDLFFHHGWPDFVRDHHIVCGDFLVFRYDGELNFTVQVFDQSACQKEAAFHSECSQDPRISDKILGQKREREEDVSSSDKIVEGVLKKMRERTSHSYSECVDNNQQARLNTRNGEGCQFEGVLVSKPCEEARLSTETKQCGCSPKSSAIPSRTEGCNEKPALDVVLFKTKAIQSISSKGDGFNLNGRVCVQMSSAHEVAQSFTSSFPYFMRIMKSFNVSGSYTLNIPYQFSMAHLPNCKVKIVLKNSQGECWTVNSVPSTRVHTSHTLCGGWMAFVRYNDIKVGDICIFELVSEYEFHVHILGEGVDCQSGKVAPSRPPAGRAVASHKNYKSLSKKMKGNSSKVHSKSLKMLELADKRVSKKHLDAAFADDTKKHGSTSKTFSRVAVCSQSKAATKKLVVCRKKGAEDELGPQARSGLRMMLALDEERVARSFTSCFPSFVKIMKKFNISGSYTLKIPYQFSTAHLPSYKTEVVLRNSRGECWTVNSIPDSKGRMVHTFCGGWMAFVRGNDVNFGDICIFELIGKCEMRVHISGVGKKELDFQGGEATLNELALVSSISHHPSL